MIAMRRIDLLVLVLHAIIHFLHFVNFVCVVFQFVLLFTLSTIGAAMLFNFLLNYLFLFAASVILMSP